MNWHLTWLWFWFLMGTMAYISKRAFYLITGPNPVANSFWQFVKVAGVPIGFRLLVDSMIYWVCFTPQLIQAGLAYFGWQQMADVVADITSYAPVACIFGVSVDPMVDWFIGAVVNKIPFLADLWPQMPGPLPQKAIVEAQVVQQKTTVTQLQTTTTTVPSDPKPPVA